LTTADTKQQIDKYIDIVGIHSDEAYALDIECSAGDTDCKRERYKVSPDQILAALRYFRQKTGRLPILYVNHHVKTVIAPKIASTADLKATRLWYARFKSDISTFFPDQQWKTYTIWQFSSEINCFDAPGTCPYRVPGTDHDMDVNVFFGSEQQLRQAWPFN
jgi:GH25 family lysozyme M1 (1,4-beta-N-acetylmuramidase)